MDNSDQKQQKQDQQNEQASNKPIRYRHGYTPIKPIRQLFKRMYCYTVLSNVECQIETLKTRSSNGTMIIKEMFRFKFDKDKIWVYKCNNPLPFINDLTPQCPLDSPCYSCDTLPADYWCKYRNACRFMDLVRNKLPKITYYTNEAKAVLFDSPGLFEVRFFDDSTRIIYNGDAIRFVKATGEELNVTDINSVSSITAYIKSLLKKASEMYEVMAKNEIYNKNYPKVIIKKATQTIRT